MSNVISDNAVSVSTDNDCCYRYDPKNYTMKVALIVQKPILLEGQYEADGKVLVLPITGNGTCKIALGRKWLFDLLIIVILKFIWEEV